MKLNKILAITSFILVMLICIGSVSAIDDAGMDDNNLTSDSSDSEFEISEEADDNLTASYDDSVLSAPRTWVVPEVSPLNNEMNNPTIQKYINDANAGDTIIINGRNYEHCHFIINKKLTIKSNVGTVMTPCSSTATSNYQGIFYISSKASGTIIEGFTINGGSMGFLDDAYGVYAKGASDITIRDCNITTSSLADDIRLENTKNVIVENVNLLEANNGIKVVKGENFNLRGSIIKNSNIGVNIIDSTKTTVTSNAISNNKRSGISFSGNSNYLTVIYNNLTENGNGISVTSPEYVYILGNYIGFNDENGVYVDNDITLVEIKGNFFNQNKKWEVFNDFHVTNLKTKGHKLEVIDNNYMINYGSGGGADLDRPVWTQIYEHKQGQYDYDAENDVYVYVGSGGEYYGHQDVMFIKYVFEINEYMHCPNTYFSPRNVWALSGNYELQLSEITQVKKGIYSISIVDENGNIATDLCSVPVTFYINKAGTSSTPQEGDVYKTVMMKNGTATVRFYNDEFDATGNVITAVFPTPGTQIDSKVSKSLAIDDENIPGIPLNTNIKVSNLNTYPNSNQEFLATLTDVNGKAISGETLTFKINSKTYNIKTDANGRAKIKISEPKEGNYVLKVTYAGDGDIDYYGTSSQVNVNIKKVNTKIVSSNLNMIPKRAEYYSVTLKDTSGKALANQYVTFKVNGKSYTKKTDSKGVAKVKLKFKKNKKTYKISITYNGNNKYNKISKTNKIIVKYSSKKAKLSTPSVTIPPKTAKYYVVSLKDANGKAISKQKVTVKINGKTYTKKTNSKGQIKIKVKFAKLKSYKVKATYKGSKIYKKASSSGKIKVAKTATKITAPTISMLPKQTKTYTVTLKANNKALSKQKITIKVNGKSYSKTTNAKGQASVSVSFASESAYSVNVNYKGTGIYKASKASGKIVVSKIVTKIEGYDRTYSKDASKEFRITLKDASGNVIKNHYVVFTLNGQAYTKTTDANGNAILNIGKLDEGSFDIITKYSGSDKYKAVSKTNKIKVLNNTNTVFIDNLPNSEIQRILNGANAGSNVEFLGNSYSGIALTIDKSLNISSTHGTILNAKANSPVFTVKANDVNITGFSINGNSGDAIVIKDAKDVDIVDNVISNNLEKSKIPSYSEATINMPGYGVSVSNSQHVMVKNNQIGLFESGIFCEYSDGISCLNNTLRENNYGIKYGFGVTNTQIMHNEITQSIGLYIMTVPEGPTGYGIFLNNSAVNVTISKNHIYANHIGISLDANYSTGIVITENTITDNVLEGIRFNAGYDLAENAIEPIVTDNAIYRNARGPSMMILGEMSANPFGIYGGGLYNDSQKLQIGPNWYGANQIVTWDNDTGVTGYGTMCPRINTTEIFFKNVTCDEGNYSVVFYKNGEIASNLPVFDLYATLNRGTDKRVEVAFNVINGVGTFSFDASDYKATDNLIEISVGSLIYSTSRVFKVTYAFNV